MQKAFLFLLAVSFSFSPILAQDNDEPKYLFSGSDNLSVTGFGGPFVTFSSFDNKFAVLVGGGGAVLINQQYFFGGYGIGLATSHYRKDLCDIACIENPQIEYGHGGFWLGYIHNYHKVIHWGISTKLGWGEISLIDEYYTYESSDKKGRDFIFVLNPQLEIELNFTQWFKMNVGAGYNITTGIDKTYIDASGTTHNYYEAADFNYPQATVSLLFGGFGKKKKSNES